MRVNNSDRECKAAFYVCITSSSAVQPGVVKSFYGFPIDNADGLFLFQSEMNNNPAQKKIAQFNGIFYGKDGKPIKGVGSLSMGIYHFVPDTGGQYSGVKLSTDSLYGVNLTFDISAPQDNIDTSVTATFYSPAAIYITNNTAIPVTKKLPADSSLLVTWNADPKNINGVNINAQFISNDSLINAGYKPIITNSVMVTDNGSTLLPASFFSKFPKGGNLMLFVGRGNSMIVQSVTYRYFLGGFINAMVPVVITK